MFHYPDVGLSLKTDRSGRCCNLLQSVHKLLHAAFGSQKSCKLFTNCCNLLQKAKNLVIGVPICLRHFLSSEEEFQARDGHAFLCASRKPPSSRVVEGRTVRATTTRVAPQSEGRDWEKKQSGFDRDPSSIN